MKVVLLSAASSIHTIRWANGLSKAGVEVHVISQHPQIEPMRDNVKVHILKYRGVLGYFTMVPAVKKLLADIQPDIVNAHYASGYGTTANLVGYRPWLLSVWGSDVYDFPYKSPLHKMLVRKNLLSANKVASTSLCMAQETTSFTPKVDNIAITPFGVDTAYYDSLTNPVSERNSSQDIVIGTVKSLAPKYGIDILLQSFSLLLKRLSEHEPEIAAKLNLRIVGSGPQEIELKQLAKRLNISEKVTFIGRVESKDVPRELDKLDIYVALSRMDSESFGVAIIEAGASGRPVVVSDAGGLPEVVINGKTGIVVPRENPKAAADAIERLVLDEQMRVNMGEAGKNHVKANYDWQNCVNNMIDLYSQIINEYTKN